MLRHAHRTPSRTTRKLGLTVLVALALASCGGATTQPPTSETNFDVLVFTKTAGFHHPSIGAGVTAIQELGTQNRFNVTATADASLFTDAGLAPYEVVVFLNTTGDVLSNDQQFTFERFIRSGRGFVGVHAATDTEYDWPWYGRLVGAYFNGHPAVQEGTVLVMNGEHPSTQHLPVSWRIAEEWYSFKDVQASIQPLLNLDESSYALQGTPAMGSQHPIAWSHEYDGGRSWYTGLGHKSETFADTNFRKHLLGGIVWAAKRDQP